MVKHGITAVAFFLAILILIATTLVRAEDPSRESQYYRDLTKQHFDLAVIQFEHKDVFGACSNLRISKGYARHINDKIIYEHITLLLDKMCSGDS
jgi:hypothetical protein